MTGDGRIITVWSIEHGGPAGQGAESADGGRTWTRIDERFPAGFKLHVDCPSIYRLIGPDGKARLWVWSQSKMFPGTTARNHYNRDYSQSMPSIMGEDEGLTWKEMPPLGGERFRCKMAFTSVVRLKDGSYMAVFHRDPPNRERSPLVVLSTISKDGGFTWSDPAVICQKKFRVKSHGHGDSHTLTHTTGQLIWIAVHDIFRIRETHFGKHGNCFVPGFLLCH